MANYEEDIRVVFYLETHRKVNMRLEWGHLIQKNEKPKSYIRREGPHSRLLRRCGFLCVGFLFLSFRFIGSHPILLATTSLLVAIFVGLMSQMLEYAFDWSNIGRTLKSPLRAIKNPSCLAQIVFLTIPKRNREHIIGDLEEEYRTSHKRFPRLWYWGQVITLVASYWWASLRRLAGFDSILKMIRK
jgi:hypothetical protein